MTGAISKRDFILDKFHLLASLNLLEEDLHSSSLNESYQIANPSDLVRGGQVADPAVQVQAELAVQRFGIGAQAVAHATTQRGRESFLPTIYNVGSGSPENDSRPGVFNLSHSGLISRFLAYPFPFRDWLP